MSVWLDLSYGSEKEHNCGDGSLGVLKCLNCLHEPCVTATASPTAHHVGERVKLL